MAAPEASGVVLPLPAATLEGGRSSDFSPSASGATSASVPPTSERSHEGTSVYPSSTTIPSLRGDKDSNVLESMAEPELLALIVEMRLRDGRGTTSKDGSKKGESAAAASAVDTMDLCHRKIQKLPEEMVDVIRDDIVRLALGYNFITTLPNSFVDLTKLRYLNVRANLMSTFPTVLCSLPSLEILDMSRNKIRKLPSEPGRLSELRVLSMSNNRLRKLPVWLARSRHLRILKLDANPIVWPPPHVSVMPALDKVGVSEGNGAISGAGLAVDDVQSKEKAQMARKKAEDKQMYVWISKLKEWVEEHKDEDGDDAEDGGGNRRKIPSPPLPHTPALRTTAPLSLRQGRAPLTAPAEAEGKVEQDAVSEEEKNGETEIMGLPVAAPLQTADGKRMSQEAPPAVQAMSKELLADTKMNAPLSQLATTPQESIAPDPNLSGAHEQATAKRVISPPPPTASKRAAPPLPSFPSTGHAFDEKAKERAVEMAVPVDSQATSPPSEWNPVSAPTLPLNKSVHARNNSLTTTAQSDASATKPSTPRRTVLQSKKSLPDLRQSHATILTSRHDNVEMMNSSESDDLQHHRQRRQNRRPTAHPAASESGFEGDASTLAGPLAQTVATAPLQIVRKPSPINTIGLAAAPSDLEDQSASTAVAPQDVSATTVEGPSTGAAVESERNSYFKRLSTLPASTISTHVSVPVLLCVDATRGVLYSLSQMHTALRQYVAFAADERMTSQLSRVLNIAGDSMATLIQTLDRFDSISRMKGDVLDHTVVRGVIIACIESIATFRKLVHVVQLQLRSLQRTADVRYTRTLLLLLYGSLAEIGNSWKMLEPLLDDVAPYLSMGGSVGVLSTSAVQAGGPSNVTGLQQQAGYLQPGLPSIAEATSPVSPSASRVIPTPPSRPQRRRHAGSFSAQDVAHGASLSSTSTNGPISAPAMSNGNDEMRRAQRTVDDKDSAMSDFDGGASKADKQNAALTSRRTLSNTSGGKVTASAGAMYSAQGMASNDPPIDDHLLQLVVKITFVAFSVWAGIEDHLVTLGLPAATKGNSIKASNGFVSATYGDESGVSGPLGSSVASTPKTPARVPRSGRQQMSEASTIEPPETPERGVMRGGDIVPIASGEIATPQSAVLTAPSPAVQRRLRQLHDLTRGVNEHTHRLHACLERAQDAIGRTPTPLSPPPSNGSGSQTGRMRHPRTGSTVSSAFSGSNAGMGEGVASVAVRSHKGGSAGVSNEGHAAVGQAQPDKPTSSSAARELFAESSHFIKSILQISHFIKGLAAERFALPKYVKASMAELTTCARDLTLHLHFLSGPPPSAHPAILMHPPASNGSHAPPTQHNSVSGPSLTTTSAPANVYNGSLQHQQQHTVQQEPTAANGNGQAVQS